jgi:predicted ArsR family transcriptional regulator
MPSERYVDVNNAAKEEWKEESDGFDRVRDVLLTTSELTTAAQISDQALVSEPTARKHLDRLVELGPAMVYKDTQGYKYTRDDAYHDFQRLAELAKDYSLKDLKEKAEDIEEELEHFSSEYQKERPHRVEPPPEDDFEPGEDHFEEMDRWKALLENYYQIQSLIDYKRSQSIW